MDQTHDSGLAEIETRQTEITNLERFVGGIIIIIVHCCGKIVSSH